MNENMISNRNGSASSSQMQVPSSKTELGREISSSKPEGTFSDTAASEVRLSESILVSILIFRNVDGAINLLKDLPEKISHALAALGLTATIVIRKNNPRLDTQALEHWFAASAGTYEGLSFTLLDDGENSGFGMGHNLNFMACESTYMLVLNDDLDFPNLDWLIPAIQDMRSRPDLALIGDSDNPRAIDPVFTNGSFPDSDLRFSLRYAEASILLVRGSAFKSIGMFDPAIAWAFGEDSDLSFKAQQMGHTIAWMHIPHRHFRSTSFNSLPDYERSSILEHNRARLFARWGEAFARGAIGQVDIFDISSDGLGDVFCALLHLRHLYQTHNREYTDHIVVNCSSTILANLMLPQGAHITSEKNVDALVDSFRERGVSSIRSIRQNNYALPFNIHPLIAGSLSLQVASQATIDGAAAVLRQVSPPPVEPKTYTVLHLEFERAGHHGRGPSEILKSQIAQALGLICDTVVIIGKSKCIELDALGITVVDLQGKQSLEEMISTVANASMFVGIDSFPFHIAQVAGIPCAAFFGSVSPALRALHQTSLWPITADLDCIGCYHDQIQPGAPFCMKMNDACTYAISRGEIEQTLLLMERNVPYDWSRLQRKLDAKLARFIEYVKYHPAPTNRLFDTVIPNQEISEMIYDLTSRIAKLNSRHTRDQFVPKLNSEIYNLNEQLKIANEHIARMEGRSTSHPEAALLPTILGTRVLLKTRDCVVIEQGESLRCRASAEDPQLEFGPFHLNGTRFGASLEALSSPPSALKIYWREEGQSYDEKRSRTLMTNENRSAPFRWLYGGDTDKLVYVRIDPSEGPAESQVWISFFGDISSAGEPRKTGFTKLNSLWRS